MKLRTLCCVLLAATVSRAADPETLFCIGTPDGACAEFGLVEQRWPGYAAAYPQPIVFTVGQSATEHWPYIHPSTRDKWAGGKPHAFAIHFNAPTAPAKPLFLTIGTLAIWEPSEIAVALNGRTLETRRLPGDAPLVHMADDPTMDGKPGALVFAVPADAMKTGANILEIRLNDGSWIIYDYVRLGTQRDPPKLAAAPVDLLSGFQTGPLAGVEEVVFASRRIVHEHWYANFSYYAFDNGKSQCGDQRVPYLDGAKLCRLNLRTRKLTTILDDPQGGIRDPQVSYDGRTILFAYRKAGSKHYHLYTIGVDGKELRQLTDGTYDDFEPSWLPDGGIVFVSSRAKRWVNCWLTQVATLHRCDADGGNLRAISSNNEHDNTPWPLPDGRVLYTRWEYVDRSQVHYHHLWTTYPDGTSQTVYFGNLVPGEVMIDAKPVPGTDKIVASFSPGHGRTEHEGAVKLVSPKSGPDALSSIKSVSKGGDFRDPWAFSEKCFMAVRGPSLVLMNEKGRTQELLRLSDEEVRAGYWLHEPRPLVPRTREVAIMNRYKPEATTGRMLLANVYEGRNMGGVKPGDIRKLLILESLPKPINFTGGMDPLSYGGTFTLERILGTVPVEADGSAYFEMPAMRSLFFVALDEKDLSVKRMQSFCTVQPGETASCIGCHEQRTLAPRPYAMPVTLAAQREPSRIAPEAGVPDVMDFPRDIQPVLDALCVDCHGYEKSAAGGPRAGRLVLSGDRGPMFSHSYYMMTIAGLFSDGRNQAKSNYEPRTLGSSASKILKMLDGTHYKVQANEEQRRKLRLWIEVGAPYPGTYAALGTGMIGGYEENHQVLVDKDWPTTVAGAETMKRRCVQCHEQPGRLLPLSIADERGVSFWQPRIGDPRLNTSRHIVFNLSRPEKSLLVLAPLAQAAGGWGLCHEADTNKPFAVFADTSDPDYRKLLAMAEAGRDRLNAIKRFDMPGFKPRIEYVREMRRYGLLPEGTDLTTVTVDPYALDRQYWESLWPQPAITAKP